MIGQYENYFVRFNGHMTPGVVGVPELTGMLSEIDARMAGCLEKPLAVRTGQVSSRRERAMGGKRFLTTTLEHRNTAALGGSNVQCPAE